MTDSHTVLKIWSDGGSRGNPGKAAVGIVMQDQQGQPVWQQGQYLGQPISNNQAEYQALYQALVQAQQFQAKQIICHLDSQLVVEQVNGRYKVKDEGLRQWWQKIQLILQTFESYQVIYVPRAQNAQADAIVNQVLDQA